MIEVEGVSTWSRKKKILDSVTFTVPDGDVFGVLGPNGSGKTALVRVLATLDVVDQGEVRIAGFSAATEAEKVRAVIGYVPEQCGFYPLLTAHEHLSFYAGIYGVSRTSMWKGAGDLLDLVGLGSHDDDPVERLSRGQKQRLSLARALVHDPELLLLDYDGSDLDPQGQVEFRELIGHLQSVGKTILLSSNNMAVMGTMCSSVGFLAAGTVVAAGPVAEVAAGHPGGLSDAFHRLTGGGAQAAGTSS